MNELALFAGAGGGILGGKLLGWRTVCAVEWNPYARRVLIARQDDGLLPPFPIWDDVQTFDGHPWRDRVDVVSGGFPCQDISAAGKGAGIDGARSGMWHHMARIIREVEPRYVFVENSPMLTSRGLGQVLGDLAAMGYDARWGVLGAVDAGAPHKRERIWIVAHAKCARLQRPAARGLHGARWPSIEPSSGSGEISDANCLHEQRIEPCIPHAQEWPEPSQRSPGSQRDGIAWWLSEPDVGRVAHGVASRVDRLRCLGNGQVPAVVRLAWHHLAPPTD